jgi:membrane protein required for colicin V production
MATLDWIFAGVLTLSLLLGAWRGLVYEVLSLLSWIAAFILAQWLAPSAAKWLPMQGAGESLRYAAGFVVVFVASVFAGGLVAFLMGKLVSAVGLRPVDRLLGALFGLARGVLLLMAVTVVVNMTPLRTSADWQASFAARVAGVLLHGLQPVLPQEFGKYLST